MKKIGLFLSTVIALTACTKVVEKNTDNKSRDGIISDRPQNISQMISVIRLKNPPLLTTLKIENGQRKVNQELADAIELEQNQLIEKLKRISSEIRVIYRYHLVLNAVTVVAPLSVENEILALPNVAVESPKGFQRPAAVFTEQTPEKAKLAIANGLTSVKFIAADKAHEKGIRGQGIRVGIIDTGVDYTHAMLGGPGTVDAYKSVNPDQPTTLFPNHKVVGGIDLVGTNFNSASDIFANRIPAPDSNPMDEGGHGSHVAGTVAGIGDGTETYSGVAPDATLYGIKVFGKDGSTSDEVVIAGLEYAADPNGDLKLDDYLHVVNMSLGSSYGFSHVMYSEAIKNLSESGTVVVASAGNSGAKDFITGSPAAVDGAFSVAASIDNMEHNWQFLASVFDLPSGEKIKVEAVEGPASKSLEEIQGADAELFYIGLANADLSEEAKAKLKGKIALIDRGQNPFVEKIKLAEAGGAIGAIVVNNQPGEAFPMGGDGKAGIPAIMIRQDVGQQIKAAMNSGAVVAHLKTSEHINKPELIDTLTDFSSKGPRSVDAILKPEISAPGQSIISAAYGEGNKGVAFSGTSMAGPHIAGVMALMKQAHSELSAVELQSMVMGTAKVIGDKNKKTYPLSQQGAGRVQVDEAVAAVVTTRPASISLGVVPIEKSKVVKKTFVLKNISDKSQTLTLKFEGHAALTMAAQTVTLEPKTEKTVTLRMNLSAASLTNVNTEVDGFVKIINGDKEVFRVAVLAYAEKISNINAESLVVKAGSAAESLDSVVELTLKNSSSQSGEALIFNKIALDGRKPAAQGARLSRICDLQAAGYRNVGSKVQFVVKIFEPITSWQLCQISILIDSNGDQDPEQELAFSMANNLGNLPQEDLKVFLLDAPGVRKIRKEFESNLPTAKPGAKPDYSPAILDLGAFKAFHGSTVAVLEIERSQLATRPSGELAVKILTTGSDDYNIEKDDYLESEKAWRSIDVSEKAPAYRDIPESVIVDGGATEVVELTKGLSLSDLLVLFPQNPNSLGTLQEDRQMQIPLATYQ